VDSADSVKNSFPGYAYFRRQVSKSSSGYNFLTPTRPSMINQADAGWAKKVSIAEYNFIPFDRGDIERF
jgi:hypothetical protein